MSLNKCVAFGLGLIVVMVMLCGETMATTGCKGEIVKLAPCISYVCGNATTPSYSCCTQLATVVKADPLCLCALVSGGRTSTGVKINETLALGLPTACSIHTPPVSRCDGNGTQASVPPAPSTKSEGSTIKLSFYFSLLLSFIYVFLIVITI